MAEPDRRACRRAPVELVPNPRNWRTHPREQRRALAGALGEVGWVVEVLVNQTTGIVVDGHLRIELALSRHEPTVPVTYIELTEEEERLVLTSRDPLSAMATAEQEQLASVLAGWPRRTGLCVRSWMTSRSTGARAHPVPSFPLEEDLPTGHRPGRSLRDGSIPEAAPEAMASFHRHPQSRGGSRTCCSRRNAPHWLTGGYSVGYEPGGEQTFWPALRRSPCATWGDR